MYPIHRQDATELKRTFEMAMSLCSPSKLGVGCMKVTPLLIRLKNYVVNIHLITPEMHQSSGQAEHYCWTVMNMIRVESIFRREHCSDIIIWKIQLTLNITVQKSTKYSPLYLLVGSESATPVIRSLVRDVALVASSPNREFLRELARQQASNSLDQNRTRQDAYVNERRNTVRSFQNGDLVFVRKTSQATGKLDSGMRGPSHWLLWQYNAGGRRVYNSMARRVDTRCVHCILWKWRASS